MGTYKTQQREALLDYMNRHRDEIHSVDGWLARMKADAAAAPSRSTAFRLMRKLEGEGAVIRVTAGGQARYQSVGCGGARRHLHLKCTGCGQLIHLSPDMSQALFRDVLQEQQFNIDLERTVLYGWCTGCRGPYEPGDLSELDVEAMG